MGELSKIRRRFGGRFDEIGLGGVFWERVGGKETQQSSKLQGGWLADNVD